MTTSNWLSLALLLTPVILLALAGLPRSWANAHRAFLRTWVTRWAGLQACLAILLAGGLLTGGFPTLSQQWWTGWEPVSIGVYYDAVTSLMFALVSLVGWVVCSYSQRYLDGEVAQGNYYRWIAVTLGAVSLMVVSGNLLMFLACWIATSLGLHQLLLHYSHRPAARRAAWTKFVISRIGDAALLVAATVLFGEYGTLEFSQLFATIDTQAITPGLQVAGCLIVVGAVTKSAQFPFHSWLPHTMETPTPVSALMHAGIVNAGGYLVIRLSPVLSLTPWVLSGLALIGGITVCYAAIVMLTQTSVKKSLAYSTIAQMGFMMLQCGLGAFSAAMLHILAHSIYKAHAFLSSGSVLSENAAMRGGEQDSTRVVSWARALQAAAISATCLLVAMAACGINPAAKAGGLLLGSILCLALTSWLSQVLATGQRPLVLRGILVCGLLCLSYSLSFSVVDAWVGASLPQASTHASLWFVTGLVALGFFAMFALQRLNTSGHSPAWLRAWYVHTSNGFYIDAWIRKTFAHLAAS